MCGREESTKVKLLLYLVGSQGQKIYSTMTFEVRERERNLKQVMDAFDKHCNPKKNETVERYKFVSRFQNPGEPLEKFITNLKLLATTCNFGDLKDSLVRHRIICGIQDKTSSSIHVLICNNALMPVEQPNCRKSKVKPWNYFFEFRQFVQM